MAKEKQDIRETLGLKETETIEKEFRGDYWSFLSQTRGYYWFTNERIIFHGGFATVEEIPYNEIDFVTKRNVGGILPIIPTGIKVKMKNGKSHTLSVQKRNDIIAFIESKM